MGVLPQVERSLSHHPDNSCGLWDLTFDCRLNNLLSAQRLSTNETSGGSIVLCDDGWADSEFCECALLHG